MNNLTLGILITIAQWMTPAPIYSHGGAVWYAPRVMEATCQYRADMAGLTYDEYMDGAVDGVAMMSPADIGKSVWINGPLGWEGPFRVCDCGMHSHVYEMVMVRGEVIEVGWETAKRWSMGPFDGGWKVQVEVSMVRPTMALGMMEPVDYVSWFEELVR